ncbi:MAG: hypothetical protein KME45_00480 [Stenomitos rutilans HA7619-LM2]|nr:hypothetical protein [Stenomitos rutilans HA7619-LM2]
MSMSVHAKDNQIEPHSIAGTYCNSRADWRPNRYEFSYLSTPLSFQFDSLTMKGSGRR